MAHVLVIDSGAGGLSIAKEILEHVSCKRLTFVSDSAFFPYGNKSILELEEIVLSLIRQALEEIKTPDVIVIACNTASTQILSQVRLEQSIPVVGVVPAIKPAGQLSQTGVIGVLATPNTVESDYLAELKQQCCPETTMLTFGTTGLAVIAERYLQEELKDPAPVVLDELRMLITPDEIASKMDVMVLACTHFPLLTHVLQQVLPELLLQPLQFIDSGQGVAMQVGRILEQSIHCDIEGVSTQCVFLNRTSHRLALQPHPFQAQYYCYLMAP